ncbi:TrmB family transcriptional regulator [Treponema sp.]|uniref:TrmB family transcriptional regulator n=1 Tax=Treponema sp. TaxID=166 RepID=UPI00298DA09A|nr:helix-turn-helix domain-containing protein [Treponema sp.]MCR5612843.1 hypothetical protein [Treponema sp.]
MDLKILEYLTDFGLSRQEALIYVELLKKGQMTGYEVSKSTGISRSNVYSALSELTAKGACYVMEGEGSKYVPVELERFLSNVMGSLSEKAEYIKANSPEQVQNVEGYLTIKGSSNIKNKIRQMIEETQLRLYILAPSDIISIFDEQLKQLVAQKKKIVILSDEYKLKGAKIYQTQVEKDQIRFITDSTYVLTGQITDSSDDTCLFSGQKNLVDVMKEYLKNKIFMIENASVEK